MEVHFAENILVGDKDGFAEQERETYAGEKETFTEQDVDLLYLLFLYTDKNNDGKLDLSEFSSLVAHENVCFPLFLCIKIYSKYIK